jgi:hypothetical protein
MEKHSSNLYEKYFEIPLSLKEIVWAKIEKELKCDENGNITFKDFYSFLS